MTRILSEKNFFVWTERTGALSPGFLTRGEKDICLSLKTDKRKREWAAGRLAAKRIASRVTGKPLEKITIEYGEGGKPFFLRNGKPFYLSISHSGEFACATALKNGSSFVGVDIEKIEKRSATWAEDYFHESEISGDERIMTFLWTVKEAVLKALGLGLSADLLDVKTNLEKPFRGEEISGEWSGEKIILASRVLEKYRTLGSPAFLAGAETINGHYIRTLIREA